jgi:hypothetical protein
MVIMNGEKVMILKKVVMAYLMALYHHLFGESEENYKNNTTRLTSSLINTGTVRHPNTSLQHYCCCLNDELGDVK